MSRPATVTPSPSKDTFLVPVLAADYDTQGRLVVTPGWADPEAGLDAPVLVALGSATPESVVEGGFGEDADGRLRLLEPVPERLRARFARVEVRTGDEIPDAIAAFAGDPSFRPAPRVRGTRTLEEARLVRLSVSESAPGWLDIDARYCAGPHEVSLSEVLASGGRYLRRGDDFVPLPADAVMEEARRARAAGCPDRGASVPISRFGLLRALARDTEAARLVEDRGGATAGAGAALRAIARGSTFEPAPSPRGYFGVLKPHQRAGLDWLWSLRKAGLGGVLADEMGLGKTHMALALLAAVAEEEGSGPSIVVAPAAVGFAWVEKAATFAPGLKLVRYEGRERRSLLEGLGPRSVVVTSYGILARDEPELGAVGWEVAILDEAQIVKNPATAAARAARRLRARMRLALTGTPIENRPGELRALIDFAVPGWLPPPERMDEIERAIASGSSDAREELRRLVHPFKLRRRKRDALPELPGKREDRIDCALTGEQWSLYREILAGARAELRSGAGLAALLGAITRLKRVCDHPALVLPADEARGMRSGKLDLLIELLEGAVRAGRKVVVFTQYVQMMDLIEMALSERAIAFADLRGATRDRARAVRRFETDPSCRVMVVSLLAGGLGIDLTAASLVVHYDRWWNRAREDQATDRVHRIGQTRGVEVLKLVTLGTLEERIDAIIAEKAQLLDEIVEADDPRICRRLGREEIEKLLE